MMQESADSGPVRIPGYQGFIPSVKSENVFGTTYGRSAANLKPGNIDAGFNIKDSERYVSVSQQVYTN